MASSQTIDSIDNCLHCKLRSEGYFCNLDERALNRLDTATYPATYPRGAVLFVEGQTPRGVFILCRGRVKLTVNSSDGRTLIFRIAEAGEVLGLSAALLDKSYPVTAETIDPTQAVFLRRLEFFNLLRQDSGAALNVAQQLGDEYHLACREIGSLGLAQSAAEKLATLFLDWAGSRSRQPGNGQNGKQAHIRLTLTHEEMAQMIGTTRETVTRLLSKFKQRQLIDRDGCFLILRDTDLLQAVSSGECDLEPR